MSKEEKPSEKKEFTAEDIAKAQQAGYMAGVWNGVQESLYQVSDRLQDAARGNLVYGDIDHPDVEDFATEEAFRQYKNYNLQLNQTIKERSMWADRIIKIADTFMLAGAVTLGGTLAAFFVPTSGVTALGVAFAAAPVVGALAASVGAFYWLKQSSMRDGAFRDMEVREYEIQRQATLIAKEMKKEFGQQEVPAVSSVELIEIPDMPDAPVIESKRADGKAWTEVISAQMQEREAGIADEVQR